MPNGNSNQPTTTNGQTDDQNFPVTFPTVVEDTVLPPMPVASEQSTVIGEQLDTTPATVTTNVGSAAPSDDVIMPEIMGTTPPKKKFAGGKVIATILGLFLLVGGVGAGVFLTGQNQDIREKAATNQLTPPCTATGCSATSFPLDFVNHYHCNDVKPFGTSCNEEYKTHLESASFEFNCGTEQIDYYNNGNKAFTSMFYDEDCTEGGGGGGIGCINAIVLYTEQGAMITDLGTLKVGQKVNLTIPTAYGANNTIHFTKARFTVNGVLRPEVTASKKFQVATVFYDLYTVTSGTTNIQAEVYYAGTWYGK